MTCSHDPRELAGLPIGMYHCPECGEMVLAGMPHTPQSLTDELANPEVVPDCPCKAFGELAERLEILRRIGERGRKLAQAGVFFPARVLPTPREEGEIHAHSKHLDLWQHLLDELRRVSPSSSTKE